MKFFRDIFSFSGSRGRQLFVRRWGLAAAFAGIALVLVGVVMRERSGSTSVPMPMPMPMPTTRTERSQQPAAHGAVAAVPVHPAAVAPAEEICGFHTVNLGKNDPTEPGRFVETVTKPRWNAWVSALVNSDDYRARAAGLFLQGTVSFGVEPGTTRPDEPRDALVQLAVGARDPAVYAVAIQMCSTYAADPVAGACERISLAEWARLDSDNAVPWLLMAGKARATQDSAAEATAFERASAAHKIDAYGNSLYVYSESALPAESTPLERYALATTLVGVEAAWWQPEFRVIFDHCSAAALRDAQVHRTCDALAELLIAKSTTLMDFGVGTRLGARVGWPDSRIQALQDESDALMQSAPTDTGSPWSCDKVQRGTDWLRRVASSGEIGAAREALERSGLSVQEAAQKHRAYVDALMRRAGARR